MTATAPARTVPPRSEIPVEFTWDLTTIYPDDEAWRQAAAALQAALPEAAALQGTLGDGPQALLTGLQLRDRLGEQLDRLHVYAHQRKDSDSTDAAGQALVESFGSLAAQVRAALAFIDPEILAIPEAQLHTWQADEPGLALYAYALQDLLRQRPHVRSSEVENVMAQFSDVTRAPSETFGILTDADLTFPTIAGEDGQPVALSHGRYRRFIESRDRRVRREAFLGYYSAYRGIRNTLGTTLAAAVRTHVVNARLRSYRSALEAALHPNDIPLEVYHNLLQTVEDSLPRLHRYMDIRKRALGVDELHTYDLYAPLATEADLSVPYREATRTVQTGLAPLGSSYLGLLGQAFSNRWIDVYENLGKRSGAYSGGCYGTAPYILLNYQDRLDDLFTLAHELGHSAHSFFTRRTQPFVYSNYTIFLAEVASTLNEALLGEHLLRTRPEPDVQRELVVRRLEDIRTVIFRQTMFARFELTIHEAAEAGQPLTTEWMSQTYHELVRRYHGPQVVADDDIALEWARVPHFYYNFYVYQYATGLSAALALARQILDEGAPAVERYLHFLGRGCSAPSIELLREAGVDMTGPAPIQQAMVTFEALLDQLEALLP